MRRSFYERPALFFGVVFFGFIALSFVVAVGPAIEIQAKHKPLPGSQPMTPQELRGFDVYSLVVATLGAVLLLIVFRIFRGGRKEE